MKRILTVLMILTFIVGSVFAVDVSGSTSADVMKGEEYFKVFLAQEYAIDIDAFHIDLEGGYEIEPKKDVRFWEYEIGASYSLAYFVFGSIINGEKDLELNENKSYVDFAYENFGFNITTLFSFDEEKDQFQGTEFSVFYKPDSIELTVGYLFTDDGAEVAGDAPDEPLDGGFYAKAKISY